MDITANVNLILHAHLPYVRHLEYPKFLEEDWLFEALHETYIPLLRVLEELEENNKRFKLTICFSPTFTTMCLDQPLQERFVNYLTSRIELGEKEVLRTQRECPEAYKSALMYLKAAKENLQYYEDCGRNILARYASLSKKGCIELVATAATNAYLPLYRNYETAIRAQIDLGVMSHVKVFGEQPKGFWLPECGYYPGVEDILEEYGIKWIQLPSQSVITAKNKLIRADHAPTLVGDSTIHSFVRDWSLTNLVWSDAYGYPCDSDYREFYRDIGYDLPMSYIQPYIHDDIRVFTGYKYWAITSKSAVNKRFYDAQKANTKVLLHSNNFLYHIRRRGLSLAAETNEIPTYTICFDADLFGHRWFEGIDFIKNILLSDTKETGINFTTPSECLNYTIESERGYFNECSWGHGGFSDVWLDGSNAWIYRHTHKAIERMQELAFRFPNQSSLKARFLNQAAREVVLAMASDWPYILYDKTSVGYAEKRLRNHLGSFNVVYSNMCKNAVNTEWLIKAEKRNAIFPDIDYNIFLPKSTK